MIKVYNTFTRNVEDFKPLNHKLVKMYTCGLTVYSQPQIGNWVAYIYSDVLVRTLLVSGYDVDRTQNITDVGHLVSDDDTGEDKMEKGAKAEGLTAWDIAEKYIKIADHEAYDLLKLLRPNRLVRATELITEQIEFVKILENKGMTYNIPNEGIYFDTSKLEGYGQLARLDSEGLMAGARVDIKGKKSVTDFALWKFSPKDKQRDMEWDSPWGKGFPGWHLECSVIARQTLGDQIDIHTGGIDHIPVHHTNEIAQTETVTGKPFSQIWFHNNHIKINGTKMSKSSGNSYTLDDLLGKGYDIEAFKLMVLSSHYKTEGNFTWEILNSSTKRLKRWQNIADLRFQTFSESSYVLSKILSETLHHLQNDLNTPMAITTLDNDFFEIVAKKGFVGANQLDQFNDVLENINKLLGINLLATSDISEDEKRLINDRSDARRSKKWEESDRLRNNLLSLGIAINDHDFGTTWSRI